MLSTVPVTDKWSTNGSCYNIDATACNIDNDGCDDVAKWTFHGQNINILLLLNYGSTALKEFGWTTTGVFQEVRFPLYVVLKWMHHGGSPGLETFIFTSCDIPQW